MYEPPDASTSFSGVTRRLGFALTGSAFLEVILFLGLFTDYSWNNTWANLLFPLFVGLVGLLVYRATRSTLVTKQQRWLKGLCYWPAMIYSVFYLVTFALAIFPLFLLATGFGISEEASRTIVERTLSPDGYKIAMVSYKPSGAYTSGLGSTDIQLTYRFFPLVKRDIYRMGKTDSPQSRTNWIEWRGDNTIYVIDEHKSINVGFVQFQIPDALLLFSIAIVMLFRFVAYLFTGS